jgi:heme/copper-type cytochrome/quinol oxidase subunit 3
MDPHVIIGSTFLIVCLLQLKSHFTSRHHYGFEAAACCWLFLFLLMRILLSYTMTDFQLVDLADSEKSQESN